MNWLAFIVALAIMVSAICYFTLGFMLSAWIQDSLLHKRLGPFGLDICVPIMVTLTWIAIPIALAAGMRTP